MIWPGRSGAANSMDKAAGILRHDHWVTKSLCEERPQDADS